MYAKPVAQETQNPLAQLLATMVSKFFAQFLNPLYESLMAASMVFQFWITGGFDKPFLIVEMEDGVVHQFVDDHGDHGAVALAFRASELVDGVDQDPVLLVDVQVARAHRFRPLN